MRASHDSYSACGLGTEQTDLLVRLVGEAGPDSGLFGARITGGGSGGTVAVLGMTEGAAAIDQITDRYQKETGHRPHLFSGSSVGAAQFGVLHLRPVGA